MNFEKVLDQAIDLIRCRSRLTYRTLQRQFDLDDHAIEDLKDELLFSHPVVDENGSQALLASCRMTHDSANA